MAEPLQRAKGASLLTGFLAPYRGLHLILFTKGVRRYLIISILGNFLAVALFCGLGGWAWFAWGTDLFQGLVPDSWGGETINSILATGSSALVIIALLFLAFFLFPVLLPILSGPLHDPLAKKIEAKVAGWPPPEFPFGFFRGIFYELNTTIKLLILQIIALVLTLFAYLIFSLVATPLVSPAVLVLSILLQSWLAAISWLDYPLARRGFSFAKKRAWIRQDFLACLGFGLAVTLSFFIPVYNFILAGPAAAAGASYLFVRIERTRED